MEEEDFALWKKEWKAAWRDFRNMQEPTLFEPLQNRRMYDSCRIYMRLRARRIYALLTANLSRQRIAGIEWRYMRASGGLWIEGTTEDGFHRVVNDVTSPFSICGIGDLEDTDGQDHLNADFIAHSRQDVDMLLNEVARLQWRLDEELNNAVYASFLESEATPSQLESAQNRFEKWKAKQQSASRAADWMAGAEVVQSD